MSPQEITAQRELTNYLSFLIIERISVSREYVGKARLPAAVIAINAFFSKILFHTAIASEPTIDEFESHGFTEDAGTIYQEALFMFAQWRDKGIEAAVYDYCQRMNRVLIRYVPIMGPGYRFHDLCVCERAIVERINNLKRLQNN